MVLTCDPTPCRLCLLRAGLLRPLLPTLLLRYCCVLQLLVLPLMLLPLLLLLQRGAGRGPAGSSG